MPKGADISIIENCWSDVKNKVYEEKERFPKSKRGKTDLFDFVCDYLTSDEMTMKIRNLYESLPRRV